MHGTLPPVRRQLLVRRENCWTFRETEVLRELWPAIAPIRARLPHRTERAIREMATRCGVAAPKDQHIWTGADDKKLREMAAAGTSRKEIANKLGLTVMQVQNRLQYRGINISRRPPIPSGDKLADAVRLRAFQMNMTMADLDRSLGNQHIFQQAPSKKRVLTKHIEKAAKALGGKLVIEWQEL